MGFKGCFGGEEYYNEIILSKEDMDYGYPNKCVDKRIISSYHHNTLYHSTFLKVEELIGMVSLFSIDNEKWFLNFKVIDHATDTKFFYWCVETCLFHKENYADDLLCLRNLNVIANTINVLCEKCGIKEVYSKGNPYTISFMLDDKKFSDIFKIKLLKSEGNSYEAFQRVYYN